jgi:hypothetical protein
MGFFHERHDGRSKPRTRVNNGDPIAAPLPAKSDEHRSAQAHRPRLVWANPKSVAAMRQSSPEPLSLVGSRIFVALVGKERQRPS